MVEGYARMMTSLPNKNLLNSIVYDLGPTKCRITELIEERMNGETPGKVITSSESEDSGFATISIAGNYNWMLLERFILQTVQQDLPLLNKIESSQRMVDLI